MSEDSSSSDEDTFAPRPEHELPFRDKEEAKADRALGGPAFVDFKKQIYDYINTQYAEEEEENAQIKEDSIEDLMLDGLAMHVEKFTVLEELFEGDEDNITSIIEISRDSELNSAFEEIFLSKKGSRIGYKLRDKRGVALIFKLNALKKIDRKYDQYIVNDIMIVEGGVMKTQAKVIKISINCSAARFKELVKAGAYLVKWNNLIAKERLIILYTEHLRQMCRENIVFKSILDVHNDRLVARRNNPDEQYFNEILYNLDSFNGLHDDQKIAVKESLSAENYYLIHGPPGTGKTLTLLVILEALAKSKKRVLLCSEANNPIDNVLVRFAETKTFSELGLQLPGKIVRLGHRTLIADECKEYTLNYQVRDYFHGRKNPSKKEVRDVQKNFIQKAKFIFSTQCSTFRYLVKDHYTSPSNYFDYVLIEEASQSFLGFSLMAISMAKRVIFAGDHKQLPPVIKEESMKRALEKSLFERLVDLRHHLDSDIMIYKLLGTQFRMNKLLIETSSRMYYDDRIRSHKKNANITLQSIRYKNGKPIRYKDGQCIPKECPLIWIDQPSHENEFTAGKYINKSEIVVILKLLEDLMFNMKVSPEDIGVITSYYSQREAILHAVEEHEKFSKIKEVLEEKLLISTVDSFQGREKDVVIYASTRANARGQIGFLKDHRRFNVAITRAKLCLIFIGSIGTLTSNHNYPMVTLHDTVTRKGLFLKWNPHVGELFVKEDKRWLIYEPPITDDKASEDSEDSSSSGNESDGYDAEEDHEHYAAEDADYYSRINHAEDDEHYDDDGINDVRQRNNRDSGKKGSQVQNHTKSTPSKTQPNGHDRETKKTEAEASNDAAKSAVSVAKVELEFSPTPQVTKLGLTRKQRALAREKAQKDKIAKRERKVESKQVADIIEEKSEPIVSPLIAPLVAAPAQKKKSKRKSKKKQDSTTNTCMNLEAKAENSLAPKSHHKNMVTQISVLINQLRSDPESFSQAIKQRLTTFEGYSFFDSAGRLRGSYEGEVACMEALVALEIAHSTTELKLDESLTKCAQDHCNYLSKICTTDHEESDAKGLRNRVNRYGAWPGILSECISIKSTTAIDFVLSWIIDDGDHRRLNLKTLLSKQFTKFGVGYNKDQCAVVVLAGDTVNNSRKSNQAIYDHLPVDMPLFLKQGPPGVRGVSGTKAVSVHGIKRKVKFTAKYNVGNGVLLEVFEVYGYDKRDNTQISFERDFIAHSDYVTDPSLRTSTVGIDCYKGFDARIQALVKKPGRISKRVVFFLKVLRNYIILRALRESIQQYSSCRLDASFNKIASKPLNTKIIDRRSNQPTKHPLMQNLEPNPKVNDFVNEIAALINMVRSNPNAFVDALNKRIATFAGNCYINFVGNTCVSYEGRSSCIEARTALENAVSSPVLQLQDGLNKCAQEHCDDLCRLNKTGDSESQKPFELEQLAKYGSWTGQVAMRVAYGRSSAKDFLVSMLIDDGNPTRPTRLAILFKHFNRLGVGYSTSHKTSKTCLVLLFAEDFIDNTNHKTVLGLANQAAEDLPAELRNMPKGAKSMTATKQIKVQGGKEVVVYTATYDMENRSKKQVVKEYEYDVVTQILDTVTTTSTTTPGIKGNPKIDASKAPISSKEQQSIAGAQIKSPPSDVSQSKLKPMADHSSSKQQQAAPNPIYASKNDAHRSSTGQNSTTHPSNLNYSHRAEPTGTKMVVKPDARDTKKPISKKDKKKEGSNCVLV